MALCPGLPRSAGIRTVKPIWILLKQETVSGSGISWAPCKSAPSSRQTTTPAPHHSVFHRPVASSCRPTNSIKALKATLRCEISGTLLTRTVIGLVFLRDTIGLETWGNGVDFAVVSGKWLCCIFATCLSHDLLLLVSLRAYVNSIMVPSRPKYTIEH